MAIRASSLLLVVVVSIIIIVVVALWTEQKTNYDSNRFPAVVVVHGFQHHPIMTVYHPNHHHSFHHHSSPKRRRIIKRRRRRRRHQYPPKALLSTTSYSSPLSLSSTTLLASKHSIDEHANNNNNNNNDDDDDGSVGRSVTEDVTTVVTKSVRAFGSMMSRIGTILLWSGIVLGDGSGSGAGARTMEEESSRSPPYHTIMSEGTLKERQDANYALMDYTVGTINTQFYDPTASANFAPHDFYQKFQQLRSYTTPQSTATTTTRTKNHNKHPPTTTSSTATNNEEMNQMPLKALDDRENVIEGLKWLVSTLQDPYSKYMTRQELLQEYAPTTYTTTTTNIDVNHKNNNNKNNNKNNKNNNKDNEFLESRLGVLIGKSNTPPEIIGATPTITQSRTPINRNNRNNNNNNNNGKDDGYYHYNHLMVSPKRNTMIQSLPMVTAVVPDSLAERNGIIVGDRFVSSIGNDDSFLLTTTNNNNNNNNNNKQKSTTQSSSSITTTDEKPNSNNEELTIAIARPVFIPSTIQPPSTSTTTTTSSSQTATPITPIDSLYTKEVLLGYRLSHVHIHDNNNNNNDVDSKKDVPGVVSGGNAVVHYQLLTPNDSLFVSSSDEKVGYIRLTRFSRSATAGYIDAVQKLEQAGAQSYIIDVRNNYGGIIQEAFLTASTLLRDPHLVLSYTMNSRGGFAPNDVQQYIIDSRYPGHLLSKVTALPTDIQKEIRFAATTRMEWAPPSSYASLHEQGIKYGIHRPTSSSATSSLSSSGREKDLVVLINEGTASSAEVFASALHDNGRLVALVGAKTYGKGLIQHTFPMPDGGGLRLTVGEYLTPSLHHVTKVGGARYNDQGELIGGGIQPDIFCPSNIGISSNVGADLCVGMALDALQQQDSLSRNPPTNNIL